MKRVVAAWIDVAGRIFPFLDDAFDLQRGRVTETAGFRHGVLKMRSAIAPIWHIQYSASFESS